MELFVALAPAVTRGTYYSHKRYSKHHQSKHHQSHYHESHKFWS